MPLHRKMPGGGAYSFSVFRTWVCAYECMPICTNVCTYVLTYVHDPVRLRLRHLYQVEFCSFIVRYPTVGASVYCGHISGFLFLPRVIQGCHGQGKKSGKWNFFWIREKSGKFVWVREVGRNWKKSGKSQWISKFCQSWDVCVSLLKSQ